jgi:6-phosphogluconolactonase (cycloisomerase 2 family)
VANPTADVISGFANDSNGALTSVVNSPFPSPGAPTAMAATPDGRFLYVYSEKNSVLTGYSINAARGVLTPLPCPVAPTGPQSGTITIAIAPSGAFFYTANPLGSEVTVFSIDANTGCLTFLQTAPTDSSLLALAVDRTGRFLYVTTLDGSVDAYSISSSGTLTRQTASDFNTGCPPLTHCGLLTPIVADPTADLLFVVVGNIGRGAVYVLTIDPSTGALTNVANSPFLAGGILPTAIAVDPSGTFVFVSSEMGGSEPGGLTAFSVAPGGALTTATGSPFAGFEPGDLAIDPSGKFLYAGYDVTSTVGPSTVGVTTYSVSSGVLTQKGTISTPPPFSIVVVRHP